MATTPNYSFSVYSSTDTDVRFLDFRVATAGSQSTSNFYVIDTVLKQHSDAIDSINATPSAFVVKGTYSSGSLYTASVANYPGYKNEQLIVLSLNQKNTGAVQININGTTNKDVMKYGSDGVLKAVDAGDFVANSPVLCLYDGTRFVVIGITSASSITVTGEAGDILQIADDGTIESSGKKAAQPNGIATLDENGNVVQVANMANSAAAVYSGAPVSIAYAGANRIASITAYGENAQGGTTEAPVALTGVDSVHVCGRNLLPNKATTGIVHGVSYTVNTDGSITAKGTATTWAPIVFTPNLSLPAGTYTLTAGALSSGTILVIARNLQSEGSIVMINGGSKTFSIAEAIENYIAFISVAPGNTVDFVCYPMLNLGSTAMPYEPYQGSVTQLPIQRALHEVGDVRDVCRTRVKSVYDKRIVLDGSSDEVFIQANIIDGWIQIATESDAVIPESLDIVGSIKSSYLNAYAINDIYLKKCSGISVDSNRRIRLSFKTSEYPDVTSVETARTYLSAHPLTVYYQSTAYDGTNGLDVCLTEYQTGFVEIDGETVRGSYAQNGERPYGIVVSPSTIVSSESLICSNANVENQNLNWGYVYAANNPIKEFIFGLIGSDITSTTELNAYFAAQKAAGTPVQVVYQLATPEQYATDPIDFNNDAGPLTVVTGGQVEVKMTDFVTDRTPAFLNKLDKTGDGSDVTVTFTEAATDTDIASGDKLSILFGKILKRFSTITSKFTTVDNSITQIESDISDITDGTTVVAQANKVTNALVIMSNSGTALVNYDGSATANMTLSPSNVGAEPAFTKNTAFNKNFGSSAGTVCQGNDGRLSNARRSSNITMSLSGTNLSISYS
jgi:hypothetical protein